MNTLQKTFFLFLALAASFASPALGQQTDAPKKSQDAVFENQIAKVTKRKVGDQKVLLTYKFKKGDVIRLQHDHRTVVETRFAQDSDKTSTRARPDYQWTVKNIDSLGNIRFDIEMQRIKILEQQGEDEPVFYDSDKHKKAPDTCLPYQERIGRVCSTYTISPDGRVVASKSHYRQVKLGGVGNNPVIAFPKKPIAIGHKWDVSSDVRAKDEYGSMQQVKLRIRYVLEKIVDGKAHITFTTDNLTPQIGETVRAQIVTHLTRGFLVFDIAKGTLTHRESRWDERVIGYQGPESYMHYAALRSETLVQDKKVAATPKAAAKPKKPVAKVAAKQRKTPGQTHTLLKPLKKQ